MYIINNGVCYMEEVVHGCLQQSTTCCNYISSQFTIHVLGFVVTCMKGNVYMLIEPLPLQQLYGCSYPR